MATFGDTNEYTAAQVVVSRWTVAGGGTKYEHIIGEYASPTFNGTADSITAFVKDLSGAEGGEEATCALYNSDSTLLAVTDEQIVESVTATAITFNFSKPKPQLTAGSYYYIVIYGDAPNVYPGKGIAYVGIGKGAAGGAGYKTQLSVNNYSTFPDPATFSDVANYDVSIYCTYTPSAEEEPINTDSSGKIALRIASLLDEDVYTVSKTAISTIHYSDTDSTGKIYARTIA